MTHVRVGNFIPGRSGREGENVSDNSGFNHSINKTEGKSENRNSLINEAGRHRHHAPSELAWH